MHSRWILLCTAILVSIVVSVVAGGEEDPALRLEKLLENPPATGFLITQVVPGTQASEAGMKAGDVVVSYGGWPVSDVQSLGAAKEHQSGAESVEVGLVRGKKSLTVRIKAGQIGINGLAVEKGVPAPTLPADTGVTFDFSPLESGPMDDWHAFTFDGRTKVGFEHGLLRLRGDTLVLRREVAFDGGEQYGLNHFDVVVIAEIRPRYRLLATRFENPLTGWIGIGRLLAGEGASGMWRAKRPEAEPRTVPAPRNLVPTYLVEHMAVFMPRKDGACFRFTPLTEGYGQIGMPSALVCEGREQLTLRGAPVSAWKYVWRQLGGAVGGVYYVGDDGRALLTDYGGPKAVLSTKEAALRNLNPGLEPRSAK